MSEDRDRLPSRLAEGLPPALRSSFEALVREVRENGRLGLKLEPTEPAGSTGAGIGERFRLQLCEPGRPASLSKVLPILENLGFEVFSEHPYEGRLAGSDTVFRVRIFELEAEIAPAGELEDACRRLEEAFRGVREGELEDDAFNRLLLAAGLDARQASLLRAYGRYLRQVGAPFSLRYMAAALERNPRVARGLVELFTSLFDPDLGARDVAEARQMVQLQELNRDLDEVVTLDDDRILHRFLSLVQATVRTNYFQLGDDGRPKPYLALKLDPARILYLPRPRPASEIYVYSPRVEALHLRGSRVARGGIRWSDRAEDFRSEVLGLLKTQLVKNTTISASGAKGGFVARRPPTEDREELQRAGVEAYRTMLHGLLDVTDDQRGERIVPPPRTVRRDGDDSYLVVAADKGTATFSDIANQVAGERGFWLGDAFASGGSLGYDHKKMGITSRGAWESVKRHFRELGRDIQSEPFTAVGVGDMSGDVFGNGMLLSRQARLLAAFNHLHVFVDPDPDPETSWRERQRLFELPRSSWDDYDRALLSAGGAVYDRSAKALTLSPEAIELLGLEDETLTPAGLIQAILRAPVDLLWLGGIGTYVKAGGESHGEVGDRANDDVRIDAAELRVRAVGEGANLGLTQAARVEYALGGGRLNTDFLDNGSGVQCSDLEVNVKIVLDEARRAGRLSSEARNQLLDEMTGEVAERVLYHAYEQNQAVSLVEYRAGALLDEQQRWIRELERRGLLDRRLEGLPDDDGFEARRASYRGLTRPEIAVFLAFAKLDLFRTLLTGPLVAAPGLARELLAYFPPTLVERFRPEIERHRLRREIVAARLTRWVIHRLGPTLVPRLAERSGAEPEVVVAASLLAREALGTEVLWRQVEALDNLAPATLQSLLHLEIADALEAAAGWLLGHRAELAARADAATLAARIEGLAAELPLRPPSPEQERRAAGFRRLRAPAELAARVAALGQAAEALKATLPGLEATSRPAADPLLLELGRRLLQEAGTRAR